MKLTELKKIIKEEIERVLNEAGTETAPTREKEKTKPATKPGNPGLNPNKETTPQTKPKAETPKRKTNEVSQGVAKLVQKYKSLKGK